MKLIVACLISILCSIGMLSAQIAQPLRVEIELDGDNNDRSVITAGEHGVMLYSRSDERPENRKKAKWYFSGYNTEFKEIWKSAYIINDTYMVREHHYANGQAFLIFGRFNDEEIVMAVVNLKTGAIQTVPGKLPKKFLINSLEVKNQFVYINGSIVKKQGLVIADLSKSKFIPVSLKFEGTATFESIAVDSLSNKVNFVYRVLNKNKYYLQVKYFEGEILQNNYSIKPEGHDQLLTGKLCTINSHEKALVGTYTTKGCTDAVGIYFARVFNDEKFDINFFNFTDFHHFFDSKSASEKERLLKRKEKKEAKGQEFNVEYQLLVHDLIEKNNEYVLVGEVYYPSYHTEPYTYTNIINGMPIVQTRYVSVFDGYVYTNAIVVGFDKKGMIRWDQSMEMGDYKSFDLKTRLELTVKDNDLLLAYGTNSDLKTMIIRGNRIIENKESNALLTNFKADEIKNSSIKNVNHWYANYFLAWGYQTIRNTSDDRVKTKRTVFYFNKIAYQ